MPPAARRIFVFLGDMSILNEAREKSEKIQDKLYENIGKSHIEKPRDYRRNARRDYLEYTKKKRPGAKVRRKAIRKQIQYLKRNLGIIRDLMGYVVSDLMSITLLFQLDILDEVYQQQFYMYMNRVNLVDHRIVSISQPHIRPIVRGKAGRHTEFGAKISLSLMDGFCFFIEHLSWENFNESTDFAMQVENYRKRYGY